MTLSHAFKRAATPKPTVVVVAESTGSLFLFGNRSLTGVSGAAGFESRATVSCWRDDDDDDDGDGGGDTDDETDGDDDGGSGLTGCFFNILVVPS